MGRVMMASLAAALLMSVAGGSNALGLLEGDAEPRLLPTGAMFVSYKGGSGLAPGYTQFATAAGKTLSSGSSLPAPLAAYDCVILNMPRAYSAEDLSALQGYVTLGGNLIAIGDSSTWLAENTEINRISAGLGSSIWILGGFHDAGFRVTSNIQPTTLTTGVSTLMYAYFAALDPGAAGRALARNADNQHVLLAAQQVGLGVFAVMADVNSLSDFSSTGYSTANNGPMANNLCNGLLLL